MMNYLKYSGASLSVTFNPYHWAWIPYARREQMTMLDDDTFVVSVLFLTFRLWIDNGEW
jgi:hypothetical protein